MSRVRGSVTRRVSTERREVVIIGGGTAGLFTAYQLAQGGAHVRLFDAAERLGPPARTLIITHRLCDVLGFEPTQAIINRTPGLQVSSPQRSASLQLRDADLIIEREILVQLLAEKAAAAGVEIHLGRRFVGLEPADDALTIRLERVSDGGTESVRTRNLVGADGACSQVAPTAGLGGFPMVSLLQARVPYPSWVQLDTTQVWFDPQSTRFFYWLEPESTNSAMVGLIADNARQAEEGLRAFLANRRLSPMAYQSAQIPFYRPQATLWRQLTGGRVFLVGDAAGQIKMTTVGGVVTGLRGAQALARAILHDRRYGWELRALHAELGLHLLVHKAASRLGPAGYDDLVGLVDPRTAHVMAAHSRDEIARVLFPSLLAQPRFLSLAARCLLQPYSRSSAGQEQAAARMPGGAQPGLPD